uniref:Nucleoprotein n=1 Tax=Buffalo Bayou virus TaxID=2651592 RepID=A0A5P8HZJ9_9VIRU|nr:nucleoprotein [Buffalo Bayou virus]
MTSFDFDINIENGIGTYKFDECYNTFLTKYQLDRDTCQKLVFKLKDMRTLIKEKQKDAKIVINGKELIVKKPGKLQDDEVNTRRLSAYITTYIFQRKLDCVNPIAESKGYSKDNAKLYWSFMPGTYMNPDDFGLNPAAICLLECKNESDVNVFFDRCLRIRFKNGKSVYDMVNGDEDMFTGLMTQISNAKKEVVTSNSYLRKTLIKSLMSQVKAIANRENK